VCNAVNGWSGCGATTPESSSYYTQEPHPWPRALQHTMVSRAPTTGQRIWLCIRGGAATMGEPRKALGIISA